MWSSKMRGGTPPSQAEDEAEDEDEGGGGGGAGAGAAARSCEELDLLLNENRFNFAMNPPVPPAPDASETLTFDGE